MEKLSPDELIKLIQKNSALVKTHPQLSKIMKQAQIEIKNIDKDKARRALDLAWERNKKGKGMITFPFSTLLIVKSETPAFLASSPLLIRSFSLISFTKFETKMYLVTF